MTIGTQRIVDYLEGRGAKLLWTLPEEDADGQLRAYTVRGAYLLLHIYGGSNGCEVYLPVGNSVDATITAIEEEISRAKGIGRFSPSVADAWR